MNAEEVYKPGSRFKLKVVHGALSLRLRFQYTDILEALEQFHEPGWRVCGFTPTDHGTIAIGYERIDP